MPDSATLVLRPLTTSAADELVQDSARAEGFAAGYAAGARRAAADAAVAAEQTARRAAADAEARRRSLDDALGLLARAADAVRALTAPVLTEASAAVHAAGLDLAHAVLGAELSDAPHAARAALARVLATEPGPGPVIVRLHPADAALLADVPVPDGFVVEADPSLHRGDALAVHADGQIDARIDAALGRARAALAQHVDRP
ncbi:FliH/SctL family protein [Cellulomonas sp.]|uniref:FliH/SctL family protein n=1 Tax=Cellulomonas sp. TaxID=40001 RepID=UPI002584E98E|nr:FliH/SctL family protein [Cellulomonas sp.]MCR6688170.1 flagellar assembly protein FliH [Cellulomonas sp.]